MIKEAIGGFLAIVGENDPVEMEVPCLLSRFFGPEEQETEGIERMRSRLSGAFVLEAQASIPEYMRGYRRIVLSLCGLVGPCTVYINGEARARWSSPPERVYLPIEKKDDPFSIRLEFAARAVCSDVGLLGGAELIAFSKDFFTGIYTEQTHKNDKCELYIRAKTLEGVGNREAMATVYAPSGEIRYAGLLNGEAHIQLSSLHKYHSHAAQATGLYRLCITLYEGGEPVDTMEARVGLRRLSFSKEGNVPFSMEVDDEAFFVKAAKISAYPSPSAEQSLADFEAALPAFLKMGGNTVFVTAERGFLSERVYEICDRLGLFVFQQLPMPPDPEGDLSAYFADLKETVAPLYNHPSLALMLLPKGISSQDALGRALKGFFAFSFPMLAVRGMPESGFAEVANVPSMPSALAVRRYLPMEARRIFSYAMEGAQEFSGQMISMLNYAAEELPYGASLQDVCYITGVSSAERAQKALLKSLERGVPGGILCGTLFEGGFSMRPALMDGLLQKKALYFDMQKAFAPVFLEAHTEAENLSVTLASACEAVVQVKISLMDRANNLLRTLQSEAELSVDSPFLLKAAFPEVLSHEREYYVHVCVLREGVVLSEKTALFVPAKHFRFVYPNLQYEIKGSGRNYELTVFASAYVRRLQLSFSKTAASFSRNYFDLTSDAKVVVAIETEEVTTSRRLGAELRLRSVYDVGRIGEQDLLDEADVDP